MMPCRGMGAISPSKTPQRKLPDTVMKRDGKEPVKLYKHGGTCKAQPKKV